MAQRRPIVLISGNFSELPTGDSTAGSSVALVANPSRSSADILGEDDVISLIVGLS